MHRTRAGSAAVLAASLALTAFVGPSATAAASPAATTVVAVAQPPDVNDADAMFVQHMLPHHREGVQMARLAVRKAAKPGVRALAAEMAKAQVAEIKTMRSMLVAWGRAATMDGMGAMPMTSATGMNRLERLSGRRFDNAWLSMMMRHHRMAIGMARTEQAEGRNADAKALAAHMASAQAADIARMKKLRRA